MGFKVGRVFRLEGEFKDTEAEGGFVVFRSTSIGVVAEIRDGTTFERDAELLAEHIVEWNFENEQGPIPVTPAGLLSLEEPLFLLLLREWMKATRGITAPFDRRSSDGGSPPTADEAAPSIPMETL